MELEQYFNIFKRWWWLMIACVLVAATSSYIGTLGMPRIYQATTTLMIGQVLQQANPNTQDIWLSQQLAQTYADMVRRRPILEAVQGSLSLQYTPSGGNVSARSVPGTQLLEISYRDTDPLRASVIANEIARQLIQQSPTESPAVVERRAFVQEQLEDLEDKIQETRAAIEEEQVKLDAANSARAIQQYQANINALEQKLSSYQSNYASYLLTAQGGTNYITQIEPASQPTNPISPNVSQTVMLAAGIGLALAVGGATLIEFLDDTIKSAEEATRLTGLPVLGGIARIEGEGFAEKLIAANHPLSPIVEAYRALRTSIQFSAVDKPLHTLMVASPAPSEGKSVTLANLAVVMAQSGLRVILVDTDLRRPVMHKFFGLSNERGLSDAIVQSAADLTEYLQPTGVEGLSLLASGTLPPNPAEMLGSQRMVEMIATLQQHADLVLFDSPPVLVVTDAVVLGTRVDGVLLVNDVGATRRNMSRQAAEELRRVQVNLLGLVLNRMSGASKGYYYYRYYRTEDGQPQRRRHRQKKGLQRWLPSLPNPRK